MSIVITGATRGIGAGLLNAYRADGKTVYGTCRCAQPDPENWAVMDVAKPDSLSALTKLVGHKPVSLLICNAGIHPDSDMDLADGYRPEIWRDVFAVNVTGVFLTIQALLTNLQIAPGAKVAIIGSDLGSSELAAGGSYAYCASKAAVINLGRNLAADLRHLDIAVGIFHPGWVRTDTGGPEAKVTVDESVAGLRARIAALGLDTTGCFESYDGRPVPF